ncbi:hypothetical protein B0H21DRAFT_710231 [Amylocystis lapponica]|nr:hypothetical protein B0H21DRAFT_710231 [Amylocystis lapponica]
MHQMSLPSSPSLAVTLLAQFLTILVLTFAWQIMPWLQVVGGLRPKENGHAAAKRTTPYARSRYIIAHVQNINTSPTKKTAAQAKIPRLREDTDVAQERNSLGQQEIGVENEAFAENVLEPEASGSGAGFVSRAGRKRRMLRALLDFLPSLTQGLPSHIPRPVRKRKDPKHVFSGEDLPSQSPPPSPLPDASTDTQPEASGSYQTNPDNFDVFRSYTVKPTTNPDDELTIGALCDSSTLIFTHPPSRSCLSAGLHGFVAGIQSAATSVSSPFLSNTVSHLMQWAYSGSHIKSATEVDRLVHDVILADDFDREDLRRFSTARELKCLDNASSVLTMADGWLEGSVHIPLPKEGSKVASEADAPLFTVSGIYYRRLLEVIKSAYQDSEAHAYHWLPFKMRSSSPGTADSESDPPDVKDIRIYSELYNSDAMLEEDAGIQALPRDPSDSPDVEVAIAPIMLWSDSTHLVSFGSAALWPIYMFFGNLSKYIQGKPSASAAHHLAYLPVLPDTLQDIYKELYGISATVGVLQFCKRELMQAIWLLLLDPEFMQAKSRIDDKPLQSMIARTRGWIFEKGYGTASKMIAQVLDLRVWKAVLTHILRILHAEGKDRIQYFNKRRVVVHCATLSMLSTCRFRKVPTFGRDTIRRFSRNVSRMKKLAARDFEDILQCIIPVIESLLPPPHNEIILDLLFDLAVWHAYAKLRLHTQTTLDIFKQATRTLGFTLHHFLVTTGTVYVTRELPKEEAARGRRTAALTAKGHGGKGKGPAKGPKIMKLNLLTYKLHALGDYPETIRRFGTTDNYTTQIGELEHRRVKRFYARTNKNNHPSQIAKLQRREQMLEAARRREGKSPAHATGKRKRKPEAEQHNEPGLQFGDQDLLPFTSPKDHHHISDSRRYHEDITRWLGENRKDPAVKAEDATGDDAEPSDSESDDNDGDDDMVIEARKDEDNEDEEVEDGEDEEGAERDAEDQEVDTEQDEDEDDNELGPEDGEDGDMDNLEDMDGFAAL